MEDIEISLQEYVIDYGIINISEVESRVNVLFESRSLRGEFLNVYFHENISSMVNFGSRGLIINVNPQS